MTKNIKCLITLLNTGKYWETEDINKEEREAQNEMKNKNKTG